MKARREIKKKPVIRKRQLRLFSLSASATTGWLVYGNRRMRCALGRSGRRAVKREGDGATPIGAFQALRAFYRGDRLLRPRAAIALRQLRRDDGWCDAPADRNYNRPVSHPYEASAEHMWRDDGLYDVVVVLDYNLRPRVRNWGSAIFLHCARDGFAPTEGCVAVRRNDLVSLLGTLRRRARLITR